MTKQKLLLPYNFTLNDKKTIDFVIQRFATHEDVEVVIFNVYTPVPAIEMQNNPIMEKIANNLMYLDHKNKEHESELKKVLDYFHSNGFSKQRISYVFRAVKHDIAQDIVDFTKDKGFDMVVLNRTHGNIKRFFTGNVFVKVVMELKDVVVLIVT